MAQTIRLWPDWWMRKGYQIDAIPEGTDQLQLVSGKYAEMNISRSAPNRWNITWNLEHGDGRVTGEIKMSDDELAGAFGLTNFGFEAPEPMLPSILKNHHFDVYMPGTYVRYGQYLNIPCPGTGMLGDPNFSICLDEQVMSAIAKLLGIPYTAPTWAQADSASS